MSAIAISSDTARHRLVGVVVLVVWICVMAALFWLFQFKFTSHWVSFQGSKLQHLTMAATHQATVVHFVDPDCVCSKFSAPHIERLEQAWPEVEFQSVSRDDATELGRRFHGMVPASPAVAMWDESGALTYFGPYTAGEICGEGEDLLSKALTSPQSGQWLNQETVGCFCPWKSGVEQ